MISPRLALVTAFLLAIPANTTPQGRICLDACSCRLTLTNNTARLYATCDNPIEFPSLHDANTSLIFLVFNTSDDLKQLDDFTCDNCKTKDIDHEDFDGVANLDAATLADGLLVQVPTDALEGDNGVVVQMVKENIVGSVEFCREFAGLRPKVDVEDCDDDDDPMVATSFEENYDDLQPRLRNSAVQDDTTPSEAETREEDADTTTATPSDVRQRNDGGDEVMDDGEGKLEGVMPVVPDEDPATVFPPWTIAVIAIVGAIIVGVAGYYIWQKWTEIRSCCCGGEYSQP